jgi:hypothetical protein
VVIVGYAGQHAIENYTVNNVGIFGKRILI